MRDLASVSVWEGGREGPRLCECVGGREGGREGPRFCECVGEREGGREGGRDLASVSVSN